MFNMLKSFKFNCMLKNTIGLNKRGLWKWIDDTFNRLDDDRIKEVGPNMACAEWLMKNGAQVRWKGCKEFVDHYDCLPHMKCGFAKQFKIEQVHVGKEATISHIGFNYFKDCKNISNISFIGCQTIDNEAIRKLKTLRDNLTNLEINGCFNVSDKGIQSLENIPTLKNLELKNLQLKNQKETISHLKTKLPECNILCHNND